MNFTPLAAIALCGAAYFPTRYKFTIPMASLLVSDVALNLFHYHASLGAIRHFALRDLRLLVCSAGRSKTALPGRRCCRFNRSVADLLFRRNCVRGCDPGYPKTFAGLVQAQTIGLPVYGGATPAWMFCATRLLAISSSPRCSSRA
jgi:hypothetical protein